MARFELNEIEAGLNTYFLGKSGNNALFEELKSTNDHAIELARQGGAEGIIVLARQQSGGRGRQGRSWISAKDSGIFLSLLLRPTLDQSILPLISFAGGVAACQAIEQVAGVKIGLKWVNDLVYNGKKLGGILAEVPGTQEEQRQQGQLILPPAVILGFGINLNVDSEQLPDELKDHVESLDKVSGKTVDANALISELCNAFEEQYNHLRHGFQELVLSQWKNYSVTLGKRIIATIGNEKLEGLAEDLSESGALVLKLDSGQTRQLHAGEISIRLDDGRYA